MKFALNDVAFSYPSVTGRRTSVLNGVTLAIESGQCLGLIGREGAGKSTLLQILDGLLCPDRGSVTADGVAITSPEEQRLLRRDVGFALQFPEEQMFCESVRAELLYGTEHAGLRQARSPEEALEAFGLDPSGLLDVSPFALCTAEARLVALASQVVPARRALLLDEPTVGLDAHALHRTLRVLQQLRNDGMTIIIVSHDIDMLAEVVDSVAVLRDGRVALNVSAAEAFCTSGLLQEFGYDPPEVVTTLAGQRAKGMRLEEGVFRFDHAADALRRARAGEGLQD